ncbi:MAG: glycosyltransferase [Chitinophagaceae bacterium]|nr:glycosyltransferase [Chitinophagaceae bacterium]
MSIGKSKYSQDGCLRLLSCSSIIPLKRLDRIIDALKLITDISVIWVHIGDGGLRQNLQSMCKDLPTNINVTFVGQFKSQEVLNYYIRNQVDLFINTSASEGVPVSIMEALSAGVPVFATDVGGTSEIIDNSVGMLLDTQPDPADIAKALKAFFLLPEQNKQELRNAAFKRFQDSCDVEVCTGNLLKFLI